ncbi:unnamed protein product [Adineta ricciae]|uniref:F-box domain-containing protein n=1 Tax=Adineta ricciae TaxID=249248 RepID=A0A815WA94_ADIRI|nr:unnamed protein product [Adineta ricciae]
MTTPVSHLLSFPDEILLEIYKYLLSVHVLYAFYGINARLNATISYYYQHISLTNIGFGQSAKFCRFILPRIGSQIRSLTINNCRSVLQGKLFAQYFSHQMSHVFRNLQKLRLLCFTADELHQFCKTLNHLECLHQIEIGDVLTDESTLFEDVINSNPGRITSIQFKTSYITPPTIIYNNLLDLTISLQTLDKIVSLFAMIPNIQQLNITIDQTSLTDVSFDAAQPLVHLKKFSLRYFNHYWSSEEIQSLLKQIPCIEHLSLQLSSSDTYFVDQKQKLMESLPETLREFHFSVRYYYDTTEEIDFHALFIARFPMICLIDESLQQAIIHTVPYRFSLLHLSFPMAKQVSTWKNYLDVEKYANYQGMTLAEALLIMSNCRQIKEIDIQYDENEQIPTVQQPVISLPNLSRLRCIWLLHPCREYQSFKSILRAAPNLSELFIAFDNLLPAFDDQEICNLLSRRIIHLLILRPVASAPKAITEDDIPKLKAIFQQLRHLQIDVTNGPSIDSIVLAVVNAFKERYQLISLVVEGQSSCEELKSNARQWLIDHSHLSSDDEFDAEFRHQTNRFLLWM